MKLVSWNVNGIRAALGRGFHEFLAGAKADVICLQETKARPEQIDSIFGDYEVIWNIAHRPGYSGTVVLTRIPPLNIRLATGTDVHDREGEVITRSSRISFWSTSMSPTRDAGSHGLITA